MAIKNTTLDTTATEVFTSVGESAITVIYFCNTNPSLVYINIYVVPSGSSANASTITYYQLEIAPGDTFVMDQEKLMLGNGDFVAASATVSGAVVTTTSYIGI